MRLIPPQNAQNSHFLRVNNFLILSAYPDIMAGKYAFILFLSGDAIHTLTAFAKLACATLTKLFPPAAKEKRNLTQGFTLIELSIVLVIIGLIVGGILVGQELIRAAEVRAQITQMEKYNTAVNTFLGKYGYLPGDIPDPYATQFGFVSRPGGIGGGNGDGIIQGIFSNCGSSPCGSGGGFFQDAGETGMFWVDLSTAHMIEGSFSTASPNTVPSSTVSGATIALYLPPAKIGRGNYVYVWSGNSINFYSISAVTSIIAPGYLSSNAVIPVSAAYTIDKKIDDAMPQTGRIQAIYLNFSASTIISWATGPGNGYDNGEIAYNTPTQGTVNTCFDNNSGNGPQQYSIEENNGAGPNCALTFIFQSGN